MRGVCPAHLGAKGKSQWLVWVMRITRWGHDWALGTVGGLAFLVKRPHSSIPSQASFGRAVPSGPMAQHQQKRPMSWSGHEWLGL